MHEGLRYMSLTLKGGGLKTLQKHKCAESIQRRRVAVLLSNPVSLCLQTKDKCRWMVKAVEAPENINHQVHQVQLTSPTVPFDFVATTAVVQ